MSRPLMTEGDRADVFRGLASPVRRRIVTMLRGGERQVGEIQAELRITGPSLSRHLEILRDCGLVQHRQAGPRRYYRLDRGHIRRAQQWLQQNS